jgi:hypothetical protein
MTDWKVQPEMHHSDHHLLTVNLPVTPDRMPLRKGRHLESIHSASQHGLRGLL